MTNLDIAREQVISASCMLAGVRINIESGSPGPNDSASIELHTELLHEAIGNYTRLFSEELEGINRG